MKKDEIIELLKEQIKGLRDDNNRLLDQIDALIKEVSSLKEALLQKGESLSKQQRLTKGLAKLVSNTSEQQQAPQSAISEEERQKIEAEKADKRKARKNNGVQQIKDAGMKAAVTLNPSTPVAMLVDIIRDVDMVLLMSVNPGFGGQKFIVHTLDKVRELRELITNTGSQALIEVDGGVNLETGRQLVEVGADVLVAGNAVFKAPDMSDMIHRLKSL